jgi:hypothetical protein
LNIQWSFAFDQNQIKAFCKSVLLSLSNIESEAQMKKIILASFVAATLAGCTTAQETASGTAAGAAIGGAVGGWRGAAIGAAVGGLGTFIAVTANGQCKYRQADGSVIQTRCHWLR